MKRITYISRFSEGLTQEDIKQIAEISVRNNKRDHLTGVLLVSGNIFYQIIEGQEEKLDYRFRKILNDKRHRDIFVLKVEENITERKYTDWAMNTVILDSTSDLLTQAVFSMLDSFSDSMEILKKYVSEMVLNDLRLGKNPLQKNPNFKDYLVIFGDVFFSSLLTEKLSVEKVSELFHFFFEIAIDKIHSKGGTVSKLMGDGLMAYFPIEKANEAIESLLEITGELKKYHNLNLEENLFSMLYAGFGISSGRVYEGNLGSKERLDFTILGNCVNVAARLEKATRRIKRNILFDESLLNFLTRNDVTYVAEIKVRNVMKPLKVYSLNQPQTQYDYEYEEIKEAIAKL